MEKIKLRITRKTKRTAEKAETEGREGKEEEGLKEVKAPPSADLYPPNLTGTAQGQKI